MTNEDLNFTVDSQLLGELGETLVTHNYIALGELIKNAYDADAKNIIIRFINARKENVILDQSEIQLIDDGQGMTFEEIKDYWMRVATPNKRRMPISLQYKRPKTGNKGIGRFACRRLARRLIIESTAKNTKTSQYESTQVVFNWDDFKSGTKVTDIPCKSVTRPSENKTSGTILRLIGLTDFWSDTEFNLLKREILALTITGAAIREGAEDPGFKIRFDAPGFPEGEGVLVDQFMDAGWGTLEGCVDDSGKVNLKLNAKNIEEKTFELPNIYAKIRGIDFKIAWIPIEKDYYRNPKLLTKEKVQKIMKEQGGVRVYLNGFRVYPYGGPRNDWLEIDQDVSVRSGAVDPILRPISLDFGIDTSRAMQLHPRNRNLVGIVKISDKSDEFKVKLDREGFIENEAYSNLREVLRLSLEWMVLHYIKFKSLVVDEELKEAREDFKHKSKLIKDESDFIKSIQKDSNIYTKIDVKPIIEDASKLVHYEVKKIASASHLSETDKKESQEAINSALQVIQKSYDQSEMSRNVLGAVASTGSMMFAFTHEIKGLIADLDTHANTIKRLSDKMPKEERIEFLKFSESLNLTRKRFDQHIKIFGVMAKRTSDIQRKRIILKDAAIEILSSFDYIIEHYHFNKPIINISDELLTKPMLESEVYSIFVNLISNAIKANLAGRGSNILIEGRLEKNGIIIRVYDDGIGLQKEYRELVFQPLSADPEGVMYDGLKSRILDEDLAVLGRGTGLGLSIVKNMIEPYDGYARFIDVDEPWKTCIEVVIP